MRAIPVDTTKIAFIGTGKAAARAEYVELSDGQRRRSGNQAKDQESGMPLWVVDVLVDDDNADRAEVVGVKVASWDEPKTTKWQPVKFINLVAVPYVDSNTHRVGLSFRCDGIEGSAPAASGKAA
jgi:hypothetical protein